MLSTSTTRYRTRFLFAWPLACRLQALWTKAGIRLSPLCSFGSSFHKLSFFATSIGSTSSTTTSEIQSVLTAQAARDATKSNESLVFFGDNFSSIVPFYGERKSLGAVPWTSPNLFNKIISDPQSLLGDAPLGGIIDCRRPGQTSAEQVGKIDAWLYNSEQMAKIDSLLANRRTIFTSGRCRLMVPDREDR